jgi:hypothetical protein
MTDECAIPGCEKPSRDVGWCKMHATRYRRHGDPLFSMRLRGLSAEELFAHHTPNRGDGCWVWLGWIQHGGGYGYWRTNRKVVYAHRWSYEHHNGPIPAGYLIRHTCDNPPCVNPAHLLIGTDADNRRDCTERGRDARGERSPRAILTDAQCAEIRQRRARGERGVDLAREFNVNQSTISGIWRGRSRAA